VTGLYYTFFSPLFRMNKRKDTRGKGIFSKLTLGFINLKKLDISRLIYNQSISGTTS